MNLILFTLQRELNTCSKLGMELEFFPKRCWHHKCTPLKYHYNKKLLTLFLRNTPQKTPCYVQDAK